MNATKIIYGTDFSPGSHHGLKYAVSLARDTGAKLLIVHVEEPPAAYGGGEWYYGIPDFDHESVASVLEKVVPEDPQVAYEHRLVTGDPARRLVELAEEEHADLIVVGTHGRTGLSRLLMGSVAEEVVRRANCPVFTFKLPSETAVEDSGKTATT